MSSKAQGERLKSFIERIEKLNEEKSNISEDITEVYAESKAVGFVPKIIREIVKRRGTDETTRQEEEALLDLYLATIGEK